MSDFTKLIEQAQKLQTNLKQSQEELQKRLKQLEVVGEAGGGIVKVTMLGTRQVTSVKIEPSISAEERAILEELLIAAFNDASRRAQKATREKMSAVMGQFGLGGDHLMDMLGGDFSQHV